LITSADCDGSASGAMMALPKLSTAKISDATNEPVEEENGETEADDDKPVVDSLIDCDDDEKASELVTPILTLEDDEEGAADELTTADDDGMGDELDDDAIDELANIEEEAAPDELTESDEDED